MRIYGDEQSGNCYKVQLLLSHLECDHEWIPIDILKGDTQTADFLALNPNGKIPILQTDDGLVVTESNAILHFLAHDTPYAPLDRLTHTRILSWQFFEQYSHEPYIAVARFINRYLGMPADRLDEFEDKQTGGNAALAVMNKHLQNHPYFVGDAMTIADISLYAYTHVANEGGFDLTQYAAVNEWLKRVASHPKHIPMNA